MASFKPAAKAPVLKSPPAASAASPHESVQTYLGQAAVFPVPLVNAGLVSHPVEACGSKSIGQAGTQGITELRISSQGAVNQCGGPVLQKLIAGKTPHSAPSVKATDGRNRSRVRQCSGGTCFGVGPAVENPRGQPGSDAGNHITAHGFIGGNVLQHRTDIAPVVDGADGRVARHPGQPGSYNGIGPAYARQ